jgi:UPF0755 protein
MDYITEPHIETPPEKSPSKPSRLFLLLTIVIVLFSIIAMCSQPPLSFPTASVLEVKQGATLTSVSRTLKEGGFIRSKTLFKSYATLLAGDTGVKAGSYWFPRPQTAYELAQRLVEGREEQAPVVLTVPEGSSVADIARIATKEMPAFDAKAFLALAKGKEGYLFPDTYHVSAHVTPEALINAMEENFTDKVLSIESQRQEFGGKLEDVITMASILEGEARLPETRQIVAGILWKRLSIGMPLQVDTTFKYINGKTSEELTLADLAIDSPYNTYKYKGLPPTPISNPGLGAILAAVTPTPTDYFYFLTDKDGVMHYAKTLAEHAANKAKYLK